MGSIQAIETVYNGYRFRSRLEARWAVFFDRLGIRYEYEKEGYDLGAAGWYLPDFWLPGHKCWIEIKGQRSTGEEQQKASVLAIQADYPVYLFDEGMPFDQDAGIVPLAWGYAPYVVDAETLGSQHNLMGAGFTWCQCPECGAFDVHGPDPETGNACTMHTECLLAYVFRKPRGSRSTDTYFDHMETTARLLDAYRVARQARFEHGEAGR